LTLTAWARRRKTSQALADRSRVILACAEGGTISGVAAELGVSRDMVSKWRARFLEKRLAGLTDEPRPGRPRLISDEQVEQVITATLEQAPAGGDTHWSTRSMARSQGMSQSAVSRIWRAFGLKPHIVETWKLSTDPRFTGKVRDVVGLYMSPPENALVLCVDEKSQIQAPDRTAPCLPMLPTTPARMTHDYVRNGTTSLFAAFDLASGSVIAQPCRRHRHQEFPRFLKLIDAAVPRDLELHLVLDNYATCKTPAVHRWLLKHPRFHLHFTPTTSSWMNLVERWFAELTNRKLRRSAHRSVTELETDIRKWTSEWNKNPKPFVWTKTADEILETLAAYCRRVSSQERQAGRRQSPAGTRVPAAARRPRSRAAAGPARTSARHGPARGSLPRPPHEPAGHGPGPGRSPGPGTREPRRLPTTGQPGPRAYNRRRLPESRSSTPRNSPAPGRRKPGRHQRQTAADTPRRHSWLAHSRRRLPWCGPAAR
jgi:transposase